MTIKTILVCLTTAEATKTLMKAAVPLARRLNAHLIGLHVIEPLVLYPGIAMDIPGGFYVDYNQSQEASATEIKEIFEHATRVEDFVSEWRLLHAGTATLADRTVDSARAADLVMMAQEKGSFGPTMDLIGHVIRSSGRPVLMVPHEYDGDGVMGENIMIGWSSTREATRAAHDLMLIATEGASVGLICVGKTAGDDLNNHPANEMAATYDRHGLTAEVVHRLPGDQKVAEVLLDEAFARGADLIVTGAFGHSYGYDLVIGAATRVLLDTATIPVLFSK
jgi:nucleotide-binding universal stress UspA family protein